MRNNILILNLVSVLLLQSFSLFYVSQVRSDLFVRTVAYNSAIDSFETCMRNERKVKYKLKKLIQENTLPSNNKW